MEKMVPNASIKDVASQKEPKPKKTSPPTPAQIKQAVASGKFRGVANIKEAIEQEKGRHDS